ncbi:hypothetical protein D3C81_1712830 [compost metagenome]
MPLRFGQSRHRHGSQFLRLPQPSLQNQLANPGQMRQRVFVVAVTRTAVPYGILIELQLLLSYAAKNHSTEPPVSNGQSLVPFPRRLAVPQLLLVFHACHH